MKDPIIKLVNKKAKLESLKIDIDFLKRIGKFCIKFAEKLEKDLTKIKGWANNN